jgi:hypothetical protein
VEALVADPGNFGNQSGVQADVYADDVEERVTEGENVIHGLANRDVVGPLIPVKAVGRSVFSIILVCVGPFQRAFGGQYLKFQVSLGCA